MELDINQPINYQRCSPDQLVSLLAFRAHWFGAMEMLVGSVNGRDAHRIQLTDGAWQAIHHGLHHKNPNVRFQCVQLLDHYGDDRIIEPVSQMLYDPVPRVRKQALHALTCEKCKTTPLCPLPSRVVDHFIELARQDTNAGVRAAALAALGTLPTSQRIVETLQTLRQNDSDPKVQKVAQCLLDGYAQKIIGQQ